VAILLCTGVFAGELPERKERAHRRNINRPEKKQSEVNVQAYNDVNGGVCRRKDSEVMDMRLAIRIVADEHGGYMAICPSLPGCMSRGTTRDEAKDKLDEAIRGYIAAVNNFIPENLIQEVVEV